ncbi:hypothetical protein MHLP_03030 [Candidatus Mycoplasma haematolamae str. Purdue]|uniref:Uncharacterized protein n=1 Tax=Mycoplasma haematolamae (strain Purdue) TaxID=1212765 RepID=I7CG27_MYCHA|nr:hypothetical protein [Candidatus Mycoplasma haematolamae]AFO52186.1 hypothetical protein MHLP_03030 [Candidatus Mycoplasma haematolamae str. Purdue]
MNYKAAGVILAVIGVGGGGTATTYTLTNTSLKSEINQEKGLSETAKAQETVAKKAVKTNTYTFTFGDKKYELACPEGSTPHDSLDLQDRKNHKLAIYCQWKKGEYRQVYEPKKTLDWDAMNSFRGQKAKCVATNQAMTEYQCQNQDKLRIEVKNNWLRRGTAAANWIWLG